MYKNKKKRDPTHIYSYTNNSTLAILYNKKHSHESPKAYKLLTLQQENARKKRSINTGALTVCYILTHLKWAKNCVVCCCFYYFWYGPHSSANSCYF